MNKINSLNCECPYEYCKKHALIRESDNIKVKIYEWPLPNQVYNIYGVLFELRMPKSVCHLRDSLFILNKYILKKEKIQSTYSTQLWIDYFELKEYSTIRPKYVTLGSTTKLFSNSHYNRFHVSNSDENFLPNNGYENGICLSTLGLSKINLYGSYEYKEFCTMKLLFPYESLQFAINDTSPYENKIISEQINCPTNLKMLEFINFGCFRSGHHLQLRNLLQSLITKNISFHDISICSLISQTLWQIGIIDFESNPLNIPSSHYDFKNIDYLNELYLVIDEYLDEIKEKWNYNLILYNMIIIILRVISLIQNELKKYEIILNKMLTLLKKCRLISNSWELKLKAVILTTNDSKEKENLINKLIQICFSSIITFNCQDNAQVFIMSNNDDIVSWLCSFGTISHYKSICSNNEDHLKLYNKAQITLLKISNQYLKIIKSSNGNVLTQFVQQIWPDSDLGEFQNWKIDSHDLYPFWYSTIFTRNDNSVTSILSININGELLINYFPIDKLPNSVLGHTEFKRFFNCSDFDVKPASNGAGSFVTDIKLNDNTVVNYTFYESDQNLIIFKLTGIKI